MSEQELLSVYYWNNYAGVAILALISYEYLIVFEKEVDFVWKRQWSLMSCLYLIVRYLGLFLAMVCGVWGGLIYMPESPCYALAVMLEWGFSLYFCFAEAILIWRLYALYNRSKRILCVLLGLLLPVVALSIGIDTYLYSRRSAFSVKEISTPVANYCTSSFNLGPMIAIYTSIPIICYDIFLVILAVVTLAKHLKERRTISMRPNTLLITIVRYHIVYFVLNLTNQILMVILWANIPAPVISLSEFFINSMPFILAPRLIISIWDTHAHNECAHVSTTFEDCICWTLPPTSEEHEIDSPISV